MPSGERKCQVLLEVNFAEVGSVAKERMMLERKGNAVSTVTATDISRAAFTVWFLPQAVAGLVDNAGVITAAKIAAGAAGRVR